MSSSNEHLNSHSAAPSHLPDFHTAAPPTAEEQGASSKTPNTASSLPSAPSPPPSSFPVPTGSPSRTHSPSGSPKPYLQHRKSSTASAHGLHRRASEHSEDRVEILRHMSKEKAVEEVDIRMPEEDVFVEDVANPDAGSPHGHPRRRSQSPLRPSSDPQPHHVTAAEPPKLQHGHSGLCSPPITTPLA